MSQIPSSGVTGTRILIFGVPWRKRQGFLKVSSFFATFLQYLMIFQIEKCRMHYETLNIHEWQKQKHLKKDGKKSGSTCLQPIFIKLDFGYTTRSTTKHKYNTYVREVRYFQFRLTSQNIRNKSSIFYIIFFSQKNIF